MLLYAWTYIFSVLSTATDDNRRKTLAKATQETARWTNRTVDDAMTPTLQLQLHQHQITCSGDKHIAQWRNAEQLIKFLALENTTFVDRRAVMGNGWPIPYVTYVNQKRIILCECLKASSCIWFIPVGETARQDAICRPSVKKTEISDALCPMSLCGNVSSRHWPVTLRLCGVRGASNFGDPTFDSLYCQTSSFRPVTAHAHPFSEQLIDTAVLRSENVSASLTTIGNGSPNDWATLFSDRVMIWLEVTDRPDTL